MTQLEQLRYPVGRFKPESPPSERTIENCIDAIASLPEELSQAVRGLSEDQLATPYRPNGWTMRQVVHHVADSHVNAVVRIKLALTEGNPTLKAYDEARWAELADVRETPIQVSLDLIAALHARWVRLLISLGPDELKRPYVHPESGPGHVEYLVQMYAWHGRHHVAHITSLRARQGW